MPKSEKDSLMMVYDFSRETDLFANVSDLWDDLSNATKSSMFFYPASRANSRFRLLGPHYTAMRIYIPPEINLASILSVDEFKMLINGDENTKRKTIDALREKEHRPRNSFQRRTDTPLSPDKSEIITRISDKSKWQPCVALNSYIYDAQKVQISTFTAVTLNELKGKLENSRNSTNKSINGILAHDIIISKNQTFGLSGRPNIPEFVISICEEATVLSREAINQVFTKGLFDIPKVIKYSNNTQLPKMSGYFYIIKDLNFRAPEVFMQALMTEEGKIRQNQNLDEMLEYDKENLPFEATEDQEDSRNPIMNMEIE